MIEEIRSLSANAWWTIAVAVVCNVPCALLGCYLVLRRMSMLGDAISHAVLPGIALAFLLSGQISGVPIILGAMSIGVLTSFLTQALHAYGKTPEDASMGVVFTSLFALGVIMLTRGVGNVDLDPGCVLYGLIEFVSLDKVDLPLGFAVPRALLTLGFALLLTVGFIVALWKELKIVSFDPALATAMGISATAVHYSLMAMVAGVTVAAFESVGSILVIAMLIVPGATAHLLTDRLGWMLVWSAVVAALTAFFGYLAADAIDTSVSGMMAAVAGGIFGLAALCAPRHGILSKVWHNLALSLRIAGEDILATLYRREEVADGRRLAIPDTRVLGFGWVARGLAMLRLWLLRQVRFSAGLSLTDDGRQAAASLVRSHRLWEKYLAEQFVLPLDHLHEPAERMEHFITPELQAQLDAALAEPSIDPHGRAIPGK